MVHAVLWLIDSDVYAKWCLAGMATAVMGATMPREFPGDHEMLTSPRPERSSNENLAEVWCKSF
jgi:hypothetical protein